MEQQLILNDQQVELTLKRLCYQLIETHENFDHSLIIGLQPRGIHVAKRLQQEMEQILNKSIICGNLDVTFYRDDFRRRTQPLLPNTTDIEFTVEDKHVILVDDVLYTGRTIRSGIDALLAFGRPKSIELLAFIDRRFNRNLPIQADYIGRTVDTISSERVTVKWKQIDGEDQVVLFTPTSHEN